MRKRVRRMEKSYRSFYKKVIRLEKEIVVLNRLSRVS